RAPKHDPRVCDVFLPPRNPFRRLAFGRRDVVVHVPDSGDCGGIHPARCAKAREGNRMTSVAIEVPKAAGAQRQASLKRNRRWALITSYVFLVIFAIFFLMPPYYMIVTALKSDAEVAHMA